MAAALAVSACSSAQPAAQAEAPSTEVWIPHQAPAPRSASSHEAAPEPPRRAAARREGRQPHHFWFLYVDEISERRDWVRIDRETWEERYPSGAVIRYRKEGRIDDGSRIGVVVRRVPDGAVDVLIPDVGAGSWVQLRVAPDGDWHPLGQVHLIE